ncbi:hypothetical protein NDU88_000352 [Pleurodeles waltl]|uniref:Uncharacterized protein n=1 Tax=Pleurodeles waltl TaxID=8319 RepID=A0AAV7UPQ4_PLEWA|nr:hypothetical protein NDU88_000352 [Pleurodeles waltl]
MESGSSRGHAARLSDWPPRLSPRSGHRFSGASRRAVVVGSCLMWATAVRCMVLSLRHLRELSPVSRILRCRFCLLARSFSPHAGSVLVSAPPPSGALGPRSPGPRVATLAVLAIGHRACLRSHNTASQGHSRCVSEPPEGSDGSTFSTFRFLNNAGVL